MSFDDSRNFDVPSSETSSYTGYKAAILRLECKGFHLSGERPTDRSLDDLTDIGYVVARIDHYDESTRMPVEGRKTIMVRGVNK